MKKIVDDSHVNKKIIVFAVILSFTMAYVLQTLFHPLYTDSGGRVSLTYQDAHEEETVDFSEYVIDDLAGYLFFQNLNENYCYWIGKSFNRDMGLKLSKLGNVNSSIVLIQWTRDLQSVVLLHGEIPGTIFYVLILSVEW